MAVAQADRQAITSQIRRTIELLTGAPGTPEEISALARYRESAIKLFEQGDPDQVIELLLVDIGHCGRIAKQDSFPLHEDISDEEFALSRALARVQMEESNRLLHALAAEYGEERVWGQTVKL